MVKLCRINKDDKNVGTMSEGVFSGRDFPFVKLLVRGNQWQISGENLPNYKH